MVNQVLQDYIRGVNRRLRHLPPELRRRLVAEITGHVILDVAALRREDPAISQEEATRRVVDEFCPPEEIEVAYGPEGGLIRRTTGQTVLRSRSLSEGAAGHASRTFVLNGSAAAGWMAVFAVLAVMAVVFIPGLLPGEDFGVQSVDEVELFRNEYGDLTGDQSMAFQVDLEGSFEVTVEVNVTQGCAQVAVQPPGQAPVATPSSCASQSFSFVTDASGAWRLDLSAQEFSGRIVITAMPA